MAGNDRSGIPADYIGPTTRLAFAREDHPGLAVAYDVVDGEKAGIHPAFRGDSELFVTCTITIPGIPPIFAWKDVPKTEERWSGPQGNRRKVTVAVELTPDLLVVLQTKALGRALKLLGFPDQLDPFKAVILWRQRNREIAAIGAKPSVSVAGELEAAVSALPTSAEPDADTNPQVEDDAYESPGEIVDEETGEIIIDNDDVALWTDLLGTMDPKHRVTVSKWASTTLGVKNIFHVNADDAAKLIDYYDEINDAATGPEEVRLDA